MPKDSFRELVEIMQTLRGESGCPWDRKQTHKSLRQYLLEETYEVLECIDQNDMEALRQELGDLLLQVVFHGQIASENQDFDIDGIIRAISEKLIARHPNVFGEQVIETAEEQVHNWERLKRLEGRDSVIDGVPKQLPSLLRAHRIQQKASHAGFDWPVVDDVWKKLLEEIEELQQVASGADRHRIEEEFGDVLFSLVNLSRFLKVNPEDALRATIEKFNRRFQKVEERIKAKGKRLEQCSLEEMDAIWEAVKEEED